MKRDRGSPYCPKKTQQSMLSLRTSETRFPKKQPLRAIKTMADGALEAMSKKFDDMYSAVGVRVSRPSGTTAKLSYCLNGLSENRNGLLVGLCVMASTGTAERGALKLIYNAVPGRRRITVGSDKGYDTKDFVAESRRERDTARREEETQRAR